MTNYCFSLSIGRVFNPLLTLEVKFHPKTLIGRIDKAECMDRVFFVRLSIYSMFTSTLS
jgi:hypothetical protein